MIYIAKWEPPAIIKYQKHFICIDTLNSINFHLSRDCLSVLCIRQSQDRETLNLIYIFGVRHWSYMSVAILLPGAIWDWKLHSCLCRVHDLRQKNLWLYTCFLKGQWLTTTTLQTRAAQFQQTCSICLSAGSYGAGLAPRETFRCFWISFPCVHIIREIIWGVKCTNRESMCSPFPLRQCYCREVVLSVTIMRVMPIRPLVKCHRWGLES